MSLAGGPGVCVHGRAVVSPEYIFTNSMRGNFPREQPRGERGRGGEGPLDVPLS